MSPIAGHTILQPDGSALVYLGEPVVIDVFDAVRAMAGRSFIVRVLSAKGDILAQAAASLVYDGEDLVARHDLTDQMAAVLGGKRSIDVTWIVHELLEGGTWWTPSQPLKFSVRTHDDPAASLPGPPGGPPAASSGRVDITQVAGAARLVVVPQGAPGAPAPGRATRVVTDNPYVLQPSDNNTQLVWPNHVDRLVVLIEPEALPLGFIGWVLQADAGGVRVPIDQDGVEILAPKNRTALRTPGGELEITCFGVNQIHVRDGDTGSADGGALLLLF